MLIDLWHMGKFDSLHRLLTMEFTFFIRSYDVLGRTTTEESPCTPWKIQQRMKNAASAAVQPIQKQEKKMRQQNNDAHELGNSPSARQSVSVYFFQT